jgi:predicted nucleic acid-binding protein
VTTLAVLDASVVVKWFVREGEADVRAADAVRARVVREREAFVVPSLLEYELLATLCRRLRAPADVNACLDLWLALGIPVVEPDGVLLALGVELAFRYRLTGHDAAYVALAKHVNGVWFTCDRPASRRVANARLVQLVTDA